MGQSLVSNMSAAVAASLVITPPTYSSWWVSEGDSDPKSLVVVWVPKTQDPLARENVSGICFELTRKESASPEESSFPLQSGILCVVVNPSSVIASLWAVPLLSQ